MRPYSWGTWKPPEAHAAPNAPEKLNGPPSFWSHPVVVLLIYFVAVFIVIALGYHFSDGAPLVP